MRGVVNPLTTIYYYYLLSKNQWIHLVELAGITCCVSIKTLMSQL